MQSGKTPNESPGYDSKQSIIEAQILELWECGVSFYCYCSLVRSDIEC